MLFHKFLRSAPAVLISFTLIQAAAAQSAPETGPVRGSLRWRAQKARSEGKSEINLPAPIIEYPGAPASLDIALMDNTVLIAKLLESKTVASGDDILTWRKYKILERLSTQSQELPPDREEDWQRSLALAPKSMLPLAGYEFLIDDYEGTATIDGVKVTLGGDGAQKLPVGSRYLLFLIFDSGRKLGGEAYGAGSLFTIDDSGTVHSRFPKYDSDDNFLLHEMRQRANGNLAGLRYLAANVTKSH